MRREYVKDEALARRFAALLLKASYRSGRDDGYTKMGARIRAYCFAIEGLASAMGGKVPMVEGLLWIDRLVWRDARGEAVRCGEAVAK